MYKQIILLSAIVAAAFADLQELKPTSIGPYIASPQSAAYVSAPASAAYVSAPASAAYVSPPAATAYFPQNYGLPYSGYRAYTGYSAYSPYTAGYPTYSGYGAYPSHTSYQSVVPQNAYDLYPFASPIVHQAKSVAAPVHAASYSIP